jgi:hypothetical protein
LKKLNQERAAQNLESENLEDALKYSKRAISISKKEIEVVKHTVEKMGLVQL